MSDTRDHIVQEAGKLFLQRNYGSVSIQDITKAVGMTKGALYHHFASKEQVFDAVARLLISSFALDYVVLPQNSLKGFYTGLARQVLERRRPDELGAQASALAYGTNVYNLLWDAMRLLPDFRAVKEDLDRQEAEAWVRAVVGAIDRGEIRGALDAPRIARLFTTVADGVGIQQALSGQPLAMVGEILELWDALYASLRP